MSVVATQVWMVWKRLFRNEMPVSRLMTREDKVQMAKSVDDDPASVDIDVILKVEAMMEGIEHRTRHKAIGDGNE